MGKSKKEKQQAYFFDNKALLALILPLAAFLAYFGIQKSSPTYTLIIR